MTRVPLTSRLDLGLTLGLRWCDAIGAGTHTFGGTD